MSNEQQLDAQLTARHVVAVCLLVGGAVVPCAALVMASNWVSPVWPALISPFGMFRLLVVHVMAAYPLAWLAAPLTGLSRSVEIVLVLTAVGIAGALLTLIHGPQIGAWMYEFGFFAKLAYRCLWAILLVAPWVFAARLLLQKARADDWNSYVNLVLALLIVVLLPAVYAEYARDRLAADAGGYMTAGRTWKAWQIVNQLALSGGNEVIRGQKVHDLLGRLAQEIRAHDSQVSTPLDNQATVDQRMQYATHLLALDQLADARATLNPVATKSPNASLMVAEILDIQGHVNDSIKASESAMAMLHDRGEESEDVNLLRVRAYTRLSAYLRKAQRYHEAEQVLLKGLARWKKNKGDFHYYLGEHYSLGGRPQKAIRHYQAAANENEQLEQFSELAIKELSLRTPACLLRRPRLVTR